MRHPTIGKGFTILELLAAITVGIALILTCGVIIKMGSAEQQEVTRELEWEREASMVVEHLRGDLAVAHRRVWCESGHEDYCQVGWFMIRSKDHQSESEAIGDLCAVGYALRDQRFGSDDDQSVRCLVRLQRDSRSVYEAIRTGNEAEIWRLDQPEEIVANGVLIFELWPMLQEVFNEWRPWHPELRAMPEAVELRLAMASPELQARLRTPEDWDWARANYHQLSGEEVHEVRTLIHLGADAD